MSNQSNQDDYQPDKDDVIMDKTVILNNNPSMSKKEFIDSVTKFSTDLSTNASHPFDPKSLPLLSNSIQLRDYQEEGIKWINWLYSRNLGGILADEMGLGKTLQAIAFLSVVLSQKPCKALIVVPLSVLNNWKEEWNKFCPSVQTIVLYGTKEERESQIQTSLSSPWSILLTTFEVFSSELDFFKKFSWEILVVDEAHRLKNPNAVLFTNLSELSIQMRVLLTGTPVQNNLNELHSLLAFSNPNIFGFDQCSLSEWFQDDESTLAQLLAPFILRRRKDDVLKLPEKKEIVVHAPLTSLQRRLYKSVLTKDLQAFESKKKTSLNNILMQLRKCVNHPYMFEGVEPEPFEAGDHLYTVSGKLIVLDELLRFLYERKKRVLIFSQMTHFLDIVQDFLTYRGYNYERLDGSIRAQERDFNPTADEQAAARVHRIGQEKETTIFRILCPNTVDEIIYKRARAKVALQRVLRDANRLTADPTMSKSSDSLESEDLMSVLIFGLDSILNPQKAGNGAQGIDTTDRDETDILIEEVHQQIERLFTQNLDLTASSSSSGVKQLDSDDSSTSQDMYQFEGVDYKRYQEALDQLRNLSISSSLKRKAEDDEDEQERQRLFEERLKAKKEAEQRKREARIAKYESLGYESFEFEDHVALQAAISATMEEEEATSEDENGDNQASKQIQFVMGDVTQPTLGPDERCFIVHVVDASGEWPHLGVFRAITSNIGPAPSQYYTSSAAPDIKNLARGSAHFIQVSASTCVVLIVAQRRRDSIELAPFEQGLTKVAKAAKAVDASVHLPRIGDRLSNVNWYAIERIIRKQLVHKNIATSVYYYRRR